MGTLFEISKVRNCRVFFEKSQDNHERFYFSAYVQLPDKHQIIIDDRLLVRLKSRVKQIIPIAAQETTTPL